MLPLQAALVPLCPPLQANHKRALRNETYFNYHPCQRSSSGTCDLSMLIVILSKEAGCRAVGHSGGGEGGSATPIVNFNTIFYMKRKRENYTQRGEGL